MFEVIMYEPADISDVVVDETRPVPAYYQVYEALRQRLGGSDLPPGSRLPTERAMAEQLGVSRATVREALTRLERDGLVNRRQGDGTYVAEPRVEHDMRFLHGFSAELARRGHRVRSKVLAMGTVRPSARLCEVLRVADGPDTVIELRRVRSLDGSPVSLETVWLSADRCAPLLGVDLNDRSLYDSLRAFGIQPVRGHEQLTATILDDFEATCLDQRVGAPAFLVERVTYDAADHPVEYVKSVLRADRFTIRTDLDLEAARSPHTPPTTES
ncbi:GntR family transcriptional regulator [Micromonospora sp. NPDC047620]|uniref:GntR family transcriptional regulator n=1 Tax=Micromonospora sp. NPDC047620 TaxID=3364251 RepID=UPI0037210E12